MIVSPVWQLNLEWSFFILYCGSTYIVLNFVRTLRLLNLDRACSPLGQGLIYIKRDTHPTHEKRGEKVKRSSSPPVVFP